MANLRDIKRRIVSVTNTQKITRAMKMVAAAKLRRAQEAILSARPYAERMGTMVDHLAARAELDAHPLLRPGTAGKVELIVVTSDKGLCGAFNSNVVQNTAAFIEETFTGREVALTVIGKKGVDLFARRAYTIRSTRLDIDGDATLDTAREIIEGVSAEFVSGEVDAVHCVYNRFRSAISQEVTCEQLLPFQPEVREDGRAPVDFVYEPTPAGLFESLLARHLQIQMHRILHESAASEHGARMTAMDSATTNAGEMIEKLTLQYNRARQDAITTELIEVISGAQAL